MPAALDVSDGDPARLPVATTVTCAFADLRSTTHPAVVLAQRPIRAQGSETTHFCDLMEQVSDLARAMVTADALHAVAAHARFCHSRGAFGLFSVRKNHPALFAAPNAQDRSAANPMRTRHTTTKTSRGRSDLRTT